MKLYQNKRFHQTYYEIIKEWSEQVTTILNKYVTKDYYGNKSVDVSPECLQELIQLNELVNVHNKLKGNSVYTVNVNSEELSLEIERHFQTDNINQSGKYSINISNWFLQRTVWSSSNRKNSPEFYKMFVESFNPTKLLYDKHLQYEDLKLKNSSSNISLQSVFDLDYYTKEQTLSKLQLEIDMCNENSKYFISKNLTELNKTRLNDLLEFKKEVEERNNDFYERRESDNCELLFNYETLILVGLGYGFFWLDKYSAYSLLKSNNLLTVSKDKLNDTLITLWIKNQFNQLNYSVSEGVIQLEEKLNKVQLDLDTRFLKKRPDKYSKYKTLKTQSDISMFNEFTKKIDIYKRIINLL